MDLPKIHIPDSSPPNTMSKDAYKLKIVSVTSKLTHWDLPIKHGQGNFLQYPEEEHQYQEYSEKYNQQDSTKTKTQQFTNIDATYENVEVKNEIIEELDSSNNFAHVEEDIKVKNEIIEEVDSANDFVHIEEGIEVKNEITEESDSFNHFVNVQEDIEVKNEIIDEVDSANDFVSIKENTEVKNEIIEELDTFNNFVRVEAEVTHDLENDKDKDINDSLHIATEPKANGEVNVSVQEFNESETIETSFINADGMMNGTKNVDRVLNHFENVDKILKHFEKVEWISKDNDKVDTAMENVTLVEEIPTFKCNFCYKAFMGSDAYYEHIKKHNSKNACPDEVKQFDAVLKVGDAVSKTSTLVKVKKIRVKRLEIDKSKKDKITKSKTIRILSDSSKTSNRSENSGDIVQNNSDSSRNNKTVDININKEELGGDTGTVKDKDNSSTAVEKNQDLLIEIPGKTKIIKLDEKKARTKRYIKVVYKKCDEDCIDDEYCTQSKECRIKRRRKSDIDAHYACEICDYRGKHKTHLNAHMLTHIRVKSFECQECGYKCVQRCHLDQHMRTHSRNKPYSCNYCDYNCVQKSQLDQHVRTHTKARPFRCNICGYSCTQQCHLDQHMRRHTGIKPYSCIFCEYTSVQRAHLDQHIMNVHSNVHVFRCHHCKYRCLQLDQLAKHMKVHNVEPA